MADEQELKGDAQILLVRTQKNKTISLSLINRPNDLETN
jgi:hypothetical protein